MNIWTGIVRHLLTAVGGAFGAKGYLSSSELDAAIGALLTLIGIAASVWAKRRIA